jgi:hypothetical protein
MGPHPLGDSFKRCEHASPPPSSDARGVGSGRLVAPPGQGSAPLLRFSLVITPMRAEDTVISSWTRGIWTDQRDARPPDPPLRGKKRDPRSHGSLAAGVAALRRWCGSCARRSHFLP